MPQIETGKLAKAFSIIKKSGVPITTGTANVDTLKPSQKDIDMGKVNKIKQGFDDRSSVKDIKPFIVSKDGYIVDGHHRWMAVRSAYPNAKVPTIIIGLPIRMAVVLYSRVADMV